MSLPLVSICVPCHNAGRYVGQAIESALAQSWGNLEVIVVNDGSTDDSAAVLAEFSQKNVHVIHEKCGTAARARNRALRDARGEFIKFFDADDLISPDLVEKQMARLEGRRDAVATCEWGRFYNDDPATYRSNPQSVWRDAPALDWLVEAWRDARPMTQPGMFLIPRKLLDIAGPWDEELTLIDDFEFFARLISHARAVLFTPKATLYYRSGVSGSLSGRKDRTSAQSAYHALVRGTQSMLALRDDPEARQSSANVMQDFIYNFYPDHQDLCADLAVRIEALGGSTLLPDGPPRFHALRKILGWKLARKIQHTFGAR